MSYAIVRNEKLTRSQAQGICVHNDRKAKNHSNKEIDIERTPLNYYLKKNELNYVKEFDRLKEENNLKGQIRSNSIIICEMIFTSDEAFFNKIGIEETKRYFNESYSFICNYKNLGEKNIISAVVHLDEGTPHMHLVYVPVIHTQDKDGKMLTLNMLLQKALNLKEAYLQKKQEESMKLYKTINNLQILKILKKY